jgi:hypothetical protein
MFYDYHLLIYGFGFFNANTHLINLIQASDADYILMETSEGRKIMQYNPDFESEKYSLIKMRKYCTMKEIMLNLNWFSHNHHPSEVKMLANFIPR